MYHNCRFLFFLLNADDWNRFKNFVILFQYSQKFSYSSSKLPISSLVVHQIALVNFRLEILITRHGFWSYMNFYPSHIPYFVQVRDADWILTVFRRHRSIQCCRTNILVFKHWNSSVFGHTLIPVDSMFPISHSGCRLTVRKMKLDKATNIADDRFSASAIFKITVVRHADSWPSEGKVWDKSKRIIHLE
jgi:hypothetical protein